MTWIIVILEVIISFQSVSVQLLVAYDLVAE